MLVPYISMMCVCVGGGEGVELFALKTLTAVSAVLVTVVAPC